jgi:hypothetical protein
LDSFPASILNVGERKTTRVAVHSGLTTSTAVAEQVRTIGLLVSRLVTPEDRETLCNGLQSLAEEYDEGWDSGSDSGLDDA